MEEKEKETPQINNEQSEELVKVIKELKNEINELKEENKTINKGIINGGVEVVKTKSRYEEMLEDLK